MPVNDKELGDLKSLYDELWQDARTLIKDMNRSIWMFLFGGFVTLIFSLIMCGSTISAVMDILSGSARQLDYLYAVGGLIGTPIMAGIGVYMVAWYFKLKKRYARLIELEKKPGE